MVLPTTDDTDNPAQWGYDVRLDDLLVRVRATQQEPGVIRRGPSQVQTVNTSELPEDFVDEVGRTYAQVEFTGGEGLRHAQRRSNPENARTKFFYSSGLRFNRQGDLEVVNQTEQITAGAGPTPIARAAYNGTALYVTDGTPDLVKYTNLSNDPPTTATEVTGAVNDLEDVATIGSVVYVATGSQVLTDQGTGTWIQASTRNATRIWRAKGTLWGAVDEILYSGLDAGSGTNEQSLPNGDTWVDVKDIGPFVLAVATSGEIFAFQSDGAGGFDLAGETEFNDEQVKAVASVYNQIIVLTQQTSDTSGNVTTRVWTSTIRDDGVLDDLRVIKEFFDQDPNVAPDLLRSAERATCYFAVDDGTDIALWQYDVGFGGLISDLIFDGLSGCVTYIQKLEGAFWIVTDNGDVWREDLNNKRSEGTFIGPLVDFFTAEPKVWDRLTLDGEFPGGGDAIRASVATDPDAVDNPAVESFWQPVKTFRDTADNTVPLNVDESRFLTLRAKVQNDAVLKSYSLRSLPPVSDEEIILNVAVGDDSVRPGKQRLRLNDYGDELWAAVRDLQGKSIELEHYALDKIWRGTILEVNTPLETIEPRGGRTRVMRILFRGEEFFEIVIDDNVWGIALWGEGLWGKTSVEDP